MKYSIEQVEIAKSLKNEGRNFSEIARIMNIPRPSLKYFFNEKHKSTRGIDKTIDYSYIIDNNLVKEYSYILGLYLGDGYIDKMPRTYRLRIALDYKYHNLNDFAQKMLETFFSKNKINRLIKKYKDKNSHINLVVYNNDIIKGLFPQIGDGKKHTRDVSLKDWQWNIIDYNYLFLGLFHSDGSYYLSKNRKTYIYSFKNRSEDILNIYKKCCDNMFLNYYETNSYYKNYDYYMKSIYIKAKDSNRLYNKIGDKVNILNSQNIVKETI
jgi:hypothetical protein